jgi:glutaredoxin
MKPVVTLYTRANCHLCEEVKQVLQAARRRAEFDYEEIDIDRDPELRRRYNDEVPWIAVNHVRAFQYYLDLEQFLRRLAATHES